MLFRSNDIRRSSNKISIFLMLNRKYCGIIFSELFISIV